MAEWFDQSLGKNGLRLFNGESKNLKQRYLKGDPVWHDAAKDNDRVRNIGNACNNFLCCGFLYFFSFVQHALQVIFSNVAPILLTSDESLNALNKELGRNKVDMRSFRPSIVVKCCDAFEEDKWNTVRIGNVILRKFKDCPRYIIIIIVFNERNCCPTRLYQFISV